MKKKITTLIIGFLLFYAFLNGCIESKNDKVYDRGFQIPSSFDIIVDDDFTDLTNGWNVNSFSKIQDAIYKSEKGFMIFVNSGVYNEKIFINKSLGLFGENPDDTIIQGFNQGDVITISDEGSVIINGFTITNGGDQYNDAGVKILTNNNTIVGNVISDNNMNGIYTINCYNNNYSNNKFLNNDDYGLYLYTSSDHNIIYKNFFNNNSMAVRVKGSTNNTITGNLFEGNRKGILFCCSARGNFAFNNIFINNSMWNADDSLNNKWDNGIIGNYWDNYNGTDNDNNGIGDSPHKIFGGNSLDNYPLMKKPDII